VPFEVTVVTGWIPITSAAAPIADVVSSWLVPVFIFVAVITACLFGLRWIRSEHLEELRSVPLFSGLSDHELLWVLRSARAVSFGPGVSIIHEGDKGGDFYLLTDGSVKVTLDGADLATLGAGSYFGEMALIDGGSRTATITAYTSVSTLVLSPVAFLRTVDREPLLARGIYAELCQRLRATGEEIDCDDTSRVDRARLADLCGRVRTHTEHPEWAPATSATKHRLLMTSLFARGS
jgi:CRP/FNR family cyclic AMP-dependent transcriptional regulator